jgi:probable HAF family extracellular repeat protein
MERPGKLICSLALLCAFVLTLNGRLSAGNYAVTGMGAFTGGASRGFGINNHGHVVGQGMLADGSWHAFMATNGMMMDLGTLGGSNSCAYALNDDDGVVGMSDLMAGAHHAFLATPGTGHMTMSDLGTLGGNNSTARSINHMGWITGEADLANGVHHAFVVTNMANMMDVDGSTDSSIGRCIDDAGDVVGDFQFGSGSPMAFMMNGAAGPTVRIASMMGGGSTGDMGGSTGGGSMGDGTGGMTMMPIGPSGTGSTACAVNGIGQTVGSVMMTDGSQHAFLATKSGMGSMSKDLGTLGGPNSQAFAINASGMAVGMSDLANGTQHAFLYDGQAMRDLNQMVPDGSGWELVEARSINDVGQIVGTGKMAGQTRAFLLTPVSSPTSVVQRPTSMVLSGGGSAILGIQMSSSDPLHYEWTRNGASLPGANDSSLTVPTVEGANAGRYNVVVRNSVGIVASESADLVVARMQARPGTQPSLTVYGAPGAAYHLDYSGDLAQAQPWTSLGAPSVAADGTLQVAPGALAGATMGFFRVTPQQP